MVKWWECSGLRKIRKQSSSRQQANKRINMNFTSIVKIYIVYSKNKCYSLCLTKRRNKRSCESRSLKEKISSISRHYCTRVTWSKENKINKKALVFSDPLRKEIGICQSVILLKDPCDKSIWHQDVINMSYHIGWKQAPTILQLTTTCNIG